MNIKKLAEKLIEKNITISFAESCTGGLLVSTLTLNPGVSSILNESYVTYSNESKVRLLGVKEETISKYGVVSKEVAYEMARGLKNKTSVKLAISSTGNAGPTKGDEKEPIGRVFVGIAYDSINTYQLDLDGSREEVIKKVVEFVYSKIEEII